MSNPLLNALLSDDPKAPGDRPSKPWSWKRKGAGVEIPCIGLETAELREIRKKALVPALNAKTGQTEETFDFELFRDLVIIAATGDTFTNPEVRQHYGVVEAPDALRIAMRRPSDYESLFKHINSLCEDDVDAETKVKN